MPRTLLDKLWDAHVVAPQKQDRSDGVPAVLYVDLHLIHEVTSPQAFAELEARGLKLHRADRTKATLDHSTPTLPADADGALAYYTPAAEHQVETLRANAARHGMVHVHFHAADLTTDLSAEPWMVGGFDRLLLDPARAGALEVLQQLPLDGLKRIVYVSCNPETLARDAAYLVDERGWRMRSAGVMDMFPHTTHVESIAVFEPA